MYDVNGNRISSSYFWENAHIDYEYDEATNANYTVIRVFKTKTDGSRQFPFVYVPNGTGVAQKSTLAMNQTKNFYIAINAGVFYVDGGANNLKPRGTVIQNGVLIQQGEDEATEYYPLTIDGNGNFSYVKQGYSGQTLVDNGIVSAVCGWCPWIIDYEDARDIITDGYNPTFNAQRQIIGQFGNGDYAIITCEGRNFDHSDGWTPSEAIAICKKIGLKFAYNLDGGGSTETVIGKKQINTIYEGANGRAVPTYIVFNGTDTFNVP